MGAALVAAAAAPAVDALLAGVQRDWLWELLGCGGTSFEPWPREQGKQELFRFSEWTMRSGWLCSLSFRIVSARTHKPTLLCNCALLRWGMFDGGNIQCAGLCELNCDVSLTALCWMDIPYGCCLLLRT